MILNMDMSIPIILFLIHTLMWEVGEKVIHNIGHGVKMAGGFL